jgi:uroporphyrin-III C-methyltransferase/precorrin-2 dehydrogenase/sirohydrochlorin ferrochelatase
MQTLPINFVLDDRRVLVVGGGSIASQKIEVLHRNGASVRVVAPAILRKILDYEPDEVFNRSFTETDLAGVDLVIAATDRMDMNVEIRNLAHERGLLVNVVDVPELCDFIFPSILRRGPLHVSVSTSGTGPAIARMLRQELEHLYPADTGPILEQLDRLRSELRNRTVCRGTCRAITECLSRMVMKKRRGDAAELMQEMKELVDKLPIENVAEQQCRSALNRGFSQWSEGIIEKVT